VQDLYCRYAGQHIFLWGLRASRDGVVCTGLGSMLNHSYLPKATAVIGSQIDGFGIDRNSVVRVETGLCVATERARVQLGAGTIV